MPAVDPGVESIDLSNPGRRIHIVGIGGAAMSAIATPLPGQRSLQQVRSMARVGGEKLRWPGWRTTKIARRNLIFFDFLPAYLNDPGRCGD